jgi:hypothetical protein
VKEARPVATRVVRVKAIVVTLAVEEIAVTLEVLAVVTLVVKVTKGHQVLVVALRDLFLI